MGIQAISLSKRQAITDDDYIVDITSFLDGYGDETDDEDTAVQFIAGPNNEGKWYRGFVKDFPALSIH